jgi:hypothetical protein
MTAIVSFEAQVKKANERALVLMNGDSSIAVLVAVGKIDKLTAWRMAIGIAVAEIQFPSSFQSGEFRPDPEPVAGTSVDEGTPRQPQPRMNAMRDRDEKINAVALTILATDPHLKKLAETDRSTAFKRAIGMAAKQISA